MKTGKLYGFDRESSVNKGVKKAAFYMPLGALLKGFIRIERCDDFVRDFLKSEIVKISPTNSEEKIRLFSALVYLDMSAPSGEPDVNYRGRMKKLLPDWYRRYFRFLASGGADLKR